VTPLHRACYAPTFDGMLPLLCVLTLVLTVQGGTGPSGATVDGVVRDADSGEVLAGAVVALVDLNRTVLTGDDGRYAFPSVMAGPQHLLVRRLGYRTRTLHLLVPSEGRLEFNVSLRPDPIPLEGLSAVPLNPVRGLDPGDSTAFPERGITHGALAHHPTLAQADPLLALTGGEVFVDPEAPTGIHVRGGAADHTGYLLDGVPVLSPYHAGGLFSALNPDALSALSLFAAAPSPALPDALSGAIVATTRPPGPAIRMASTVSNTEARVTVDGPAAGGASYLVSWRTGLTGALAPGDEPSYLTGETGDLLGASRLRALGGVLRLLVYDSENELAPASGVPLEEGEPSPPNRFEWASRSAGASWHWSRSPTLTASVGVWTAGSDAGSSWSGEASPVTLGSERTDFGVRASVTRKTARSATETGLRFRSTSTAYRISGGPSPGSWDASGSIRVVTAFGEHARRLGPGLEGWAGASASLAGGELLVAPRTSLRWRPREGLAFTAAYSRTHQFAQSLRNPESIVGHVFPADLPVASGVGGVPVPVSDQLVLAVELRPLPGLRLGAQAYERRLRDLVLVAPVEPGPFASSTFITGSARARGGSLEIAANGARFGVIASYGLQRVRVAHADTVYTPRHGTGHTLDAGVTVFPSATSSLRLAVSAATGRTATGVSGPFEWETCNVIDQGCEFAGSPTLVGALGGVRLPAYARVDIGGRKHWHMRVYGRDLLVGVFGTVSNLFGRTNTLNYVVDPATGDREGIEMLPRTPLVVGIDTRF
jgi:hypothetical protein